LRSRAFRFVGAVVGLVLALGLAEAGLRLAMASLPIPTLVFLHRDLKDRYPVVYARLREVVPNLERRREDMAMGWTFRPAMHVDGRNEDGEPYDRTTTADGFFTPDNPAPATPQLIVLGDSFLSMFNVAQPIAWVMREQLGQPIYNLSVGGWGPESYRAAYEKFGRGRAHSQVVVFTFVNDITDVMNWQAWQAEELPGMSFLTWIQRANPDGDAINTSDAWLDRHSVAWNLIQQALWRPPANAGGASRPPVAAPVVESFPGRAGATFPLQFLDGLPFTVNDAEAFQPGGSYYIYLQSYFESLERLKHAIAAEGAAMTLVWIPSKERVYLPLLPPTRLKAHVTNASQQVDGLERVMAQYARQSGLAYLDTTPALEAAARNGERLYFSVDGHLNNAGNVLVGRTVSEFLRNPAPPAGAPGAAFLPYRSGSVTIATPVSLGETAMRSPLAQPAAGGWALAGQAESQFGYIAQWPERQVTAPMFVTVRGRVRHGGFTVGLLEDNKWAATVNVTARGRFDVALPVMRAGRYTLTLAHSLPAGDLKTDVEITEMGWTPIGAPPLPQ
jgi:hypothetical protein